MLDKELMLCYNEDAVNLSELGWVTGVKFRHPLYK